MLLFYTGIWTEWWCEKSTEIYYNATAEHWKNPAKNLAVEIVKIGTGRVRAFALPLTINERTPFCYLIFCFPPSPASYANENNSHLILFHILLVRNILRQRGRFICKAFAFAFYYLLYYVVNSKVLLFANNYHLNIIIICE